MEMIGEWIAKGVPAAITVAARWAQTQENEITKYDLEAMLEMLQPFMNEEEDGMPLARTLGKCTRCVKAFFAKARADYDRSVSSGENEPVVLKYVMDINILDKLTVLWDCASEAAVRAWIDVERANTSVSLLRLRSGSIVNERTTSTGRARETDHYYIMKRYHDLQLTVDDIDWRFIGDIIFKGVTHLRYFLISITHCTTVGSWKDRTVDEFDYIRLLEDDNLDLPVDVAGIRNSIEVAGALLRATLILDNKMNKYDVPKTDKRRVGCEILFKAFREHTIYELEMFGAMYGDREADLTGTQVAQFRSVEEVQGDGGRSGPSWIRWEHRQQSPSVVQ